MTRCCGTNYLAISSGVGRARLFELSTLKASRVRCDLFMMHKIITRKVHVDPDEFCAFASAGTRSVQGEQG